MDIRLFNVIVIIKPKSDLLEEKEEEEAKLNLASQAYRSANCTDEHAAKPTVIGIKLSG